ncbi:MAG: class A beta-lactamase-related serine hydrolase [bacterium]|jgi:beta-lactamase class A|nr:class A beta-lactamase-related serine hydrolase [bacterium]
MKKFAPLLIMIIIMLNIKVSEPKNISRELPYYLQSEKIRPLFQLVNKELQKELERKLKQNKSWAKLINNEKMAVGLVDISDSSDIKFARVNGDLMMYAASLPKLAILLAAAQSLDDKTLPETPAILHDMRIMISRSDNDAATRMIDRIGFEKIESVLTDPKYELYDVERGGGLWCGKRYAKDSKRYPDPLMGLSHGATVTQACRFYYMLAMGQLVNRKRSIQMLNVLSDPEIHHKFVNTLDSIAPGVKLYRKSGTWRNWHSDSVMVWGPAWRKYILVGLIDNKQGENILRELIPAVEEILKSQARHKAVEKWMK